MASSGRGQQGPAVDNTLLQWLVNIIKNWGSLGVNNNVCIVQVIIIKNWASLGVNNNVGRGRRCPRPGSCLWQRSSYREMTGEHLAWQEEPGEMEE